MISATSGSPPSGPRLSRSEGRSGPGPDLERAVAAGHTSFRLPVEWAEAEPVEGRYDDGVFEHYGDVCRAGRARGLEPVIVLHGVDLPPWLGTDFWLSLEAPARFEAWATRAAEHLGGHCRRWITLTEPNAVAWRAWITGGLPPHRVAAVGDLVRSLDHMLVAHVLSHAAIHAAGPDPVVQLDVRPMPVYELDGLLVDVLTARCRGVGRYDLRQWLTESRDAWYRSRSPLSLTARAGRHPARSAVPLEQALPRTVAAVYDGPHERPFG